MRCETSLFSLTLYKKELRRYWPMWAVWLAGWLLAIPVLLWSESRWHPADHMAYEVARYREYIPTSSSFIAVVAPIVAVAVYFYLFRSSAANFAGALPMRREGLFFTAFAAGLTILILPLAAVAAVTLLVECAIGAVDAGAILSWLGGCALMCFFWLCFATLCCVISGNAVAAVSFYAIFNAVVVVMTYLIQCVLAEFLYGFDQFSERVWDGVFWCTPIYRMTLSARLLEESTTPVSRFEMLWMYAAVGFLMLIAAIWLHHIRHAERAGDLIAFVPIRWVFRISVTLCGGLSLGMLLAAIIFQGRSSIGEGSILAGCCAVAAAISYFAAEMLLAKSFKVFQKSWKGAVIGAVCFVIAICAIDMDWIGFTRRVPQPGQVKSAEARFYGNVDPAVMGGLVYDGQTVKDLIALHQYLVDHRDADGSNYGRVELTYDLGLTSLRRSYSFHYNTYGIANDFRIAAIQSGQVAFDLDRSTPTGGYVELPGLTGRELTAVEAQTLWEAAKEDVSAGRYGPETNPADGSWANHIEFYWSYGDRAVQQQELYLRPGLTATNAALEELGVRRSLEALMAGQEVPETVQVDWDARDLA